MVKLQGKGALVTGATRDIGAGIAGCLAASRINDMRQGLQ